MLCPACGFPDYTTGEPYGERQGYAGMGICPCCFWEPGVTDDPDGWAEAKASILESLRAYRLRRDPSVWVGRSEMSPRAWDGRAQLARLFALAPHVR